MNWKKFAGPAILFALALLFYVVANVFVDAEFEEGETVESGNSFSICGTYLMSALSCLGSIVWFAFAVGTKTQQTVFLAVPSNSQHTPVPLVKDTHSTVAPSTISGVPVSYVREKFIIAKSEGDTEQMVGFLFIAGSVLMFVLMIILGALWILSGIGPGLGGSGGTCDETCESIGSAAEFSMWASLLLFPCGLIALARPWSWFNSDQDIRDPVVKVRIGIVSGIALIAIISFGWPALLVVGIALAIFASTRFVNK